ncbi:DUF2784 domain-containing protein [Polluticoccus soli]|uniref:DUF2784 domain-containing protein n=1 Tax=Polluticoccus soli TaxID=3034150 RepID=UPI0023E2A30C|nr:DUF2784 domain-containing protein [Flavipsychrobacter sp. JY13-12]
MLQFFDILLTVVHLLVIGFNLLGWIWPKTRRAHLVCVLLTAGSWLVLGIWFGWGYCPITDWQWDVKTKLGETNLPNSFIKYYADKLTGKDFDAGFIDTVTAVSFAIAGLLSLYFNFFKRKHSTSSSDKNG